MNEVVKSNEAVKEVLFSYLKWFLFTAVLATLGSLLAEFLNSHVSFSSFEMRIFQLVAFVVEATSLGQCGYSIQTWRGKSTAEKLNQNLFAYISNAGFFLLVVSFQIQASN